ncbi:hypothetical protein N1851_006351 [Merluccius polli]|uniref:Uncharacterized protein n=1 Tax=Merluccius polli TaxID=89951 RepID=A0AA47PAI7_MERPO|nr:hypothetical protein N1851_006351 [Merluccius polli]
MELADSIFWTNRTSVLKYINNETTRFQTFVANRVSEIAKVEWPQNPDGLEEISPKDPEVRTITVNAAQLRKKKQASSVLAQLHLDNIHQKVLPQKETRNLETQENSGLTVELLANAEMEIICFCQKKRFADEISSLRKGMNIKRTSHIHKKIRIKSC